MRVALVSCSSQKLPHPAPAADLYTSDLFRKSRAWAERYCDSWAILSARHGLVLPGQVLAPYNLALSNLTAVQRRAWAASTRDQLVAHYGRVAHLGQGAGPAVVLPQFVVLGGAHYVAAVEGLGDVQAPLAGLGIGHRLALLKASLASPRVPGRRP